MVVISVLSWPADANFSCIVAVHFVVFGIGNRNTNKLLPQVTDKLYHLILYKILCIEYNLEQTSLVVKGMIA
jgi:hypothetical protein